MTLGAIAGVIGLAGFVPYFASAWRGTTRPDPATWLVWSVVGAILAVSYVAAGADETIWVPIGYAIGTIAIAILALVRERGRWSGTDRIAAAGAAGSLGLWAVSREPMTALVTSMAVDLFGAIPTVRNVVLDPRSESGFAWSLFLVANSLNLLALPSLALEHSLFPIYLFVLSAVVTPLALRRRPSDR